MKALVIMLDTNFMIGFEVFWKSFIANNPWWLMNPLWDLVVIDVGLTERDREFISEINPGTIFKEPQKYNYKGVNFNATADHLKSTLYTLEIFSYTEYDRIVFLDVDLLILGDLTKVFNCSSPIAGVACYDAGKDDLRDEFNAGVFVINKPTIHDLTYRELINVASIGAALPEQKAMNRYFRGKVDFLPKIYNVEKRMLHTKRYTGILESARVIHYVACKPWQSKEGHKDIEKTYGTLEERWHEWKKKKMEDICLKLS